MNDITEGTLRPFERSFSSGGGTFARIGHGSIGGKAQGLVNIRDALANVKSHQNPEFSIYIPSLTVIATDSFDDFLKQNDLLGIAHSDLRDDQIAHTFQRAELPAELTGDLRALISRVHHPLAIRSSSLLEDAMFEPFAGVYATKMVPNNQHDPDIRFRKLVEAIKYVYASTWFADAKDYVAATKRSMTDEKMAVVIQEVVGSKFNNRFYPQISGVMRSYNFYPAGHAKPEDGVVELALGLGRIIVDEAVGWSFSPAQPHANPPYNDVSDLLKQSQTEFWAIHMGSPLPYDPVKETEHMLKYSVSEAEKDGNLNFLASTYVPQDDRIRMGIGTPGPRILDFASILKLNAIPLNSVLQDILKVCEETLNSMVEIEFAVTLDPERALPARLGFLQVRPMVVSQHKVEVTLEELSDENAVVASESVLGNGDIQAIVDIVYIKPESFELSHTARMARELEQLNHQLVQARRPYVLLGFGRWGTSDPQGGIPVNFGQISGAAVIVEAALPDMNLLLSQGSHFFHNITSFHVCYFSVACPGKYEINWKWLDRQLVLNETEHCRHVRADKPLHIRVDGRTGRGIICHER